jgi:tetratricopeptide (TPR) repeat protein
LLGSLAAPSAARIDDAETRPASAPASQPASRPARASETTQTTQPTQDERTVAMEARLRELDELARKLASSEPVDLAKLEEEFPAPPRDVEKRTREARERVTALEESWLSAHETRVAAVERARIALATPKVDPTKTESAPAPHPLADADLLRGATALFLAGAFDRAAERLAAAEGAEARYLEGRAFDALDRVEDAYKSYKLAKDQAKSDPRLLAAIERAHKALEWKTKFGRPEDLIEPIRNSSYSGFQSLRNVGADAKTNEPDGRRAR